MAFHRGYYESRLGPAVYECPAAEICGELLLKRQFSINEGVLDAIFDIDITTNDQFLQSYQAVICKTEV